MRISVWQQFSSNHSAAFTVVGTFDSEDKARIAAAQLETILHKIDDWWERLSPEERGTWGEKTETSSLTPPETELSAEYKVAWPFSINWYHWAWDRSENPVKLFRNLVLVENPHPYILKGPQPFNSLLTSFGGAVSIGVSESQTYPDTFLTAALKCSAPNETVAQSITEAVGDYIKDEGANPWVVYHSGSLDPRAEELRQIETQALIEWPIEERIYKENEELKTRIMHAQIQRDVAKVALLQNEYDELLKQALGGKPPINWREHSWVLDAMSNSRLDLEFVEHYSELITSIQRTNLELHFSGLRFENWYTGLRAIYAWLSAQGCSGIQITFSQIKDNGREQS